MHDIEQRLVRCFSIVFPELSEQQIVTTSADDTGVWDSLSSVTLIALIQEEFGIALDTDAGDCMSFRGILGRLNELMAGRGSQNIAQCKAE